MDPFKVYHVGGTTGSVYLMAVHELDLRTLVWRRLDSHRNEPRPPSPQPNSAPEPNLITRSLLQMRAPLPNFTRALGEWWRRDLRSLNLLAISVRATASSGDGDTGDQSTDEDMEFIDSLAADIEWLETPLFSEAERALIDLDEEAVVHVNDPSVATARLPREDLDRPGDIPLSLPMNTYLHYTERLDDYHRVAGVPPGRYRHECFCDGSRVLLFGGGRPLLSYAFEKVADLSRCYSLCFLPVFTSYYALIVTLTRICLYCRYRHSISSCANG